LSGILLALILQFFNIQFYVVGPPLGALVGLIIGIAMGANKNKNK